MVADVALEVERRCLRSEERPVITRFWLFDGCVGGRKDCWKGTAHLGRSCGSKTLAPGHYGDDHAEPDQVILALRAWMIYRWQQNEGRFLLRGCRRRAWQREVESLRRAIHHHGGELALQPQTQERLREWAPKALDP